LIFVVFFVPLAVYLLILGHINRGPRPLIVSGTWDFIGVLFAASGFLLAGGPAIVTALSEHWRMFWLFGDRSALAESSLPGVSLAVAYFLVIIIGCIVVFSRQRQLTCIYNVEPATVEGTLLEACAYLGLDPIHSGNLLVFGLSLDGLAQSPPLEGIQAPHSLPRTGRITLEPPTTENDSPTAEDFAGQNAILEMEPFASGRHVTLRWDPHDSPLRPALESELDRRLALRGAPEHDTGLWLTLSGFGLLALSVVIVFLVFLGTVLRR
jgi:hypothetical protein